MALLALIAVACLGLVTTKARAADQLRPSLAPTFLTATGNTSGLQMISTTTPVSIAERPGDSQKERLRRMKLYRTLGIAAAMGTAAVVGTLVAGPAVGTAAGSAVLIVYLILP